jgi:hypothetical protein
MPVVVVGEVAAIEIEHVTEVVVVVEEHLIEVVVEVEKKQVQNDADCGHQQKEERKCAVWK